MTFSDYLKKHPDLYQNLDIDDPTKQAIFDWFQFREVCDDERFGVYFRRLLLTTLIKYDELVRIEPGISKYDWLVQDYMENQRIIQAKEKGKENINKQTSTTNTYLDNQQGNIEDDLTRRGTDTNTETLGAKRSLTNDLTSSNNSTIVKGQQIDTNHEVSKLKRSTDTKEANADIMDSKNVDRLLPMETTDIQQSNLILGNREFGQGLHILQWNNATSQNQHTNTTLSDHQLTSNEQDDNTKDNNITQGQRTDTNNSTVKDTGTQITQDSGTNTQETEYNSGENNLRNISLSNNGNSKQEGQSKDDLNKEKANLTVNQMQYTGRHKEIADLLEKASQFIKNSCAFDYLRKELEVVFMHIIDF